MFINEGGVGSWPIAAGVGGDSNSNLDVIAGVGGGSNSNSTFSGVSKSSGTCVASAHLHPYSSLSSLSSSVIVISSGKGTAVAAAPLPDTCT